MTNLKDTIDLIQDGELLDAETLNRPVESLADEVDIKFSEIELVMQEGFTPTEKAKLSGIEVGATKNATDATLLARANHTGVQAISTVTGLDTALALKVDKEVGKGLSDANFTQAEKDKLSSLESSKFVGLFVSESALPATGSVGDYANVDGGDGNDVYRVIWDSTNNKWVTVQGVSTELTDAQIKQQYESNPDTNVFTDAQKTKLTGIAVEATKNRADSANADKVHTHTTAQVTGLDTALAGKADKTTQVIAGTGLTGGGTLASNRTLSVSYGTASGTAAQGNDSRINNGQTAFGWGSHASAGYAKTKADVGLSGIPDTNASTTNFLRGDGTWVTPPNTNTTYTEITTAEIDAGTASTLRTISGRRMKYALDKKSDTGHTHTWANVTGKPTTFTPSTHTHSLSQITDAGSVASLNTNASTANFLRGDGTWVTPPNTNTTYSEITTAEIDAGTASTSRTITGRRMKYALDKKADTGTQVIAGTGLSGGGTLAANRTLNVSYGTTTGTAAQGNDSRIVNAVPNSRTITAGTGLSGGGNLSANRTLTVSYGTTTGTAAQGNDSRITGALQSSQVVQVAGTSTANVMSQKATTDAIANIPSVSKTSAYTVVAADKGKSIDTTANVTIRASVFTVGDVIVVTNTSATNSTIIPASGVTIRLAGSSLSGTRTLAGYGVATLRMVSNNVWFASGAGLT